MFYSKRDLRGHLRRVQFNDEAKKQGILVQEMSEFHGYTDGKVHSCADCDRSFPSSSQLKRHQQYIHLKIMIKNTCEPCGKQFVSKSDMVRHIKHVHLKIRDHVCSGKCPVIIVVPGPYRPNGFPIHFSHSRIDTDGASLLKHLFALILFEFSTVLHNWCTNSNKFPSGFQWNIPQLI